MLKIVLRSKQKFSAARFNVNFRSVFAVSVLKSDFLCHLKFSLLFFNIKSFTQVESQDKTGRVNLNETICLFLLIFLNLFQEMSILLGCLKRARISLLLSSKKATFVRTLDFSPSVSKNAHTLQ